MSSAVLSKTARFTCSAIIGDGRKSVGGRPERNGVVLVAVGLLSAATRAGCSGDGAFSG